MVTPLPCFATGHRKIYKQDLRKLDIKFRKLVRGIVGPPGGLAWSAPWRDILHKWNGQPQCRQIFAWYICIPLRNLRRRSGERWDLIKFCCFPVPWNGRLGPSRFNSTLISNVNDIGKSTSDVAWGWIILLIDGSYDLHLFAHWYDIGIVQAQCGDDLVVSLPVGTIGPLSRTVGMLVPSYEAILSP